MADDTNVGGIKGTLSLDIDPWDASVAKVKADVAALKSAEADVQVTANTTEAVEELSAVEATVKALDAQSATVTVKVTESGDGATSAAEAAAAQSALASATGDAAAAADAQAASNAVDSASTDNLVASLFAEAAAASDAAAAMDEDAASQDADTASTIANTVAKKASTEASSASASMVGVVGGAIGAVFALLGPATAAAAGLGGALVGMGAAGVLAVVGVKDEMAGATVVGEDYSNAISALKVDLDVLGDTSATAMLGSFQDIEKKITADLPALNDQVHTFAGILGTSADALLDGVLNGLKVANPLLVEGAQYVEQLAQGFSNWTSDGGLQQFVTYAEAELPRVEVTIGLVGHALADMAQSAAPLGTTLLDAADGLSKLISGLSSIEKGTDDIDAFTKKVAGGVPILSDMYNAAEDVLNPIEGLAKATGPLQPLIDKWTGATNDNKTATIAANAASTAQLSTVQQLAAEYGMSVPAYQAAASAAASQTTSTQAATQAMQLEDDAAGLLTAAIDNMNGKTLDVAEAQTAFAAANNAATTSFKTNGAAINGSTAAAVANQQAVQQQVQSAQSLAEAQAKANGETGASVQDLQASKTALENSLKAQGDLTPAVLAYINTIFKIPAVAPTKAEVDTAAAAAAIAAHKKMLADIPHSTMTTLEADRTAAKKTISDMEADLITVPAQHKTQLLADIAAAKANLQALDDAIGRVPTVISITAAVHANTSGLPTNASLSAALGGGHSHGGTIAQHFAQGGTSGTVWGSVGSGTSDSIETWLSGGEEVASQHAMSYPGARSVVKAINANPAATMQVLSQPRQQVSPISLTVVNKTGVALDDLIEIHIQRASQKEKVALSAGMQNASF